MSEYEAYERGVNAGLGWALAGGPAKAPEPENPYAEEDGDPKPQPSEGPDYWTDLAFWQERHLYEEDCPHEHTSFDRVLCGMCDGPHTWCDDCGARLDQCLPLVNRYEFSDDGWFEDFA